MPRLPVTLLALVACCSHAAAQTHDNRTVDAIATLAPAPSSLSINGSSPLRFSELLAPDVNVGACEYNMDYKGYMLPVAHDVSAAGGICEARGSWNAGSVSIGCDAGRRVAITYAVESLETDRGAIFSVNDDQIGFEAEGVHHNIRCSDDNAAQLAVGGTLKLLRGTTVPEGELTVGRVTIDIFYEACVCD